MNSRVLSIFFYTVLLLAKNKQREAFFLASLCSSYFIKLSSRSAALQSEHVSYMAAFDSLVPSIRFF